MGLKSPNNPFSKKFHLLRWELETKDVSRLPLRINCRTSLYCNELHVRVEYTASERFLLEDVVITVHLPTLSEALNVELVHGDWSCDKSFGFSKRQWSNAHLSCLGFFASVLISWKSARFTGSFLASELCVSSFAVSLVDADGSSVSGVSFLLLDGSSRTSAGGDAAFSADGKASNGGAVFFKTAVKCKRHMVCIFIFGRGQQHVAVRDKVCTSGLKQVSVAVAVPSSITTLKQYLFVIGRLRAMVWA
ncbi:coatomer subunit delta-like protein [Tanacetum coccineum]|uniref:Coatomer subunit delta n=1 Tax=Tanacetum coccineum TaxID=301880 RepID=A0ABQ4XYY1_9ASTR